MFNRQMLVLAFVALTTVASDVSAHERFRLVGTIARRQPTMIEITLKEGRKVWVELDKKTVVTRDKKKVPRTELKAGQSVVVDALGDDASDLVAQEVKLVPALPAPPKTVK
jgi:hypothetical protein